MSQPLGCLGAVFAWFLPRESSHPSSAPLYHQRDDFLSRAELSFFHVLRQAVGDAYIICPKVRLGDLVFVPRGSGSLAAKNRIDRKHVDFVLCEPQTMHPVVAVELDDASHARTERQQRDALVNEVFRSAGLRLVRVPVQAGYDLASLRGLLVPSPEVSASGEGTMQAASLTYSYCGDPVCPRCGVAMVERRASRGEKAGETFFGCVNYPKCRHTAPGSAPADREASGSASS